jgi:hypothetical protein
MVSKLTIEIVLAISCYDSLQKTSIFKYKRPEASLYGFKSNLFYFLFLCTQHYQKEREMQPTRSLKIYIHTYPTQVDSEYIEKAKKRKKIKKVRTRATRETKA